ncbi:MAG: hypothetical protein PUB18_04785 [bacterium]|nr:hypothetical protein [bacterium]
MKEIKIAMYADYAKDVDSDEIWKKDDVVEYIKNMRVNSSSNRSSKCDSKAKVVKYIFESDGKVVRVGISEKYKNVNKEYIEALEEWLFIDKKHRGHILKPITKIAITATGLSLLAASYKLYYTSPEYRISKLIWETDVHGGHGWIGDEKAYPQYSHGCIFGENTGGKSLDERIEEYCIKYDLGEDITQAAQEKMRAYLNDDLETAESIDLHDIYRESKGNSK